MTWPLGRDTRVPTRGILRSFKVLVKCDCQTELASEARSETAALFWRVLGATQNRIALLFSELVLYNI